MSVQPKYFSVEGTPLRFLKFVQITLVIGLVMRGAQLASLIGSRADWYSIAYDFVGLVLTLLSLCWLGAMKWKGVLAYCGLYFLIIVDGVLALLIYAYYGIFEDIGTVFGQILGAVIVLALLRVYFGKRRMLFEPAPAAKKKAVAIPSERHIVPKRGEKEFCIDESTGEVIWGTSTAPQYENNIEVRFCRHCGSELVPDSKFCSICGTKVVREW